MKKTIALLGVLLCSLLIIKPLFVKGYFPMHDDTQVARVVVMGKALRQGQFPVRWVSDLGYGYGYPVFNFYGPLPYYVGGALYAVGVDSLIATKIMFGIGALAAPVLLFLSISPIFGTLISALAALFFAYAPYHAVQIYIRGAVGEYWATAFLPLIIWGLVEIYVSKRIKRGIVLGSLGVALVILSHTILGYLTVGILLTIGLLYSLILFVQKKHSTVLMRPYGMFVLLGLGISAFFWLPAFIEMGTTGVSSMISGASSGFYDHFVCLGQLWNSPWGYAGSAPGCVDGMSFKLGKFHNIVTLLGLVAYLLYKKKKSTESIWGFMTLCITLFMLTVLSTLSVSGIFWNVIPYASFVQYPWRMLSFVILFQSVLGGFLLTMFRSKNIRYLVAFVVLGVCIGMNARIFAPQYTYLREGSQFEKPSELRFTVSKISDEYMPKGFVRPTIVQDVSGGFISSDNHVEVHMITDLDTHITAELDSPVPQKITIQRAYFSGWQYAVNGEKVAPVVERGLPSMIVSQGKSTLDMRLVNTPVRTAANLISLVAVGFLCVMCYGKKTYT